VPWHRVDRIPLFCPNFPPFICRRRKDPCREAGNQHSPDRLVSPLCWNICIAFAPMDVPLLPRDTSILSHSHSRQRPLSRLCKAPSDRKPFLRNAVKNSRAAFRAVLGGGRRATRAGVNQGLLGLRGGAMSTDSKLGATLETLKFDNTFIRDLPADPVSPEMRLHFQNAQRRMRTTWVM